MALLRKIVRICSNKLRSYVFNILKVSFIPFIITDSF